MAAVLSRGFVQVGVLSLAAVALVACALGAAGPIGCGGATFLLGGADGSIGDGQAATDAPDPSDAPGEAAPGFDAAPACPGGQVMCSGRCVQGNDCSGCSNARLYCRPTRTCVSTCMQCARAPSTPLPIECFACDTSQNNPVGTCEAPGSGFCLNGDYSQARGGAAGEHCDCSNTDVKNCLAPSHVCIASGGTDWCVTCGESGSNTHGLPCKGGGTCRADASPPRCE
jgi:hypothetical protein